MKKILVLLFTIFSFAVYAQTLNYSEGMITYEGEEVKTIDVKLEPKVETIKDKFSDWMDDEYNVDLDGKKLLFFDKEFMTANGVVIPEISDRKIDLKVKVNETDAGSTELNVFASYGYNNWITPEDHPYEYTMLKGIVFDFVENYLPEYYLNQVKESKEKVEDLVENKEDFNSEIEENKREIEKLQKELEELMFKLQLNQDKLIKARQNLKRNQVDYNAIIKRVDGQ